MSAGWSQTARRPGAGRAGLGLLDELRDDSNDEDGNELQRVNEALRKLCWQAGRDDEGRTIICVAASLIPDPQYVAHDVLLSCLVVTLQEWVAADYVLVLFAAGGRNYPALSWFWSAWSSLGRPFRKNLRRLYLVHPTIFTKTLFNFAAPLVSPKFYRKIAYVRTLSDLAAVVPMRQILVPPEAVRANLTLEQSVTLPSLVAPEVFGRPLSALMPRPNADLPLVISQSTSFLRRSDRLATEGPFRKSPSCGILRALEEAYDRGSPVDLELFRDAHLAAVLIKTLFKRLPAPLFGPEAYPVIRRCPRIKPESERQALDYIQNRIIGPLAPEAKRLLGHVIYLLHDTSLQASTNLMTSANLAVVFTPNLLRSTNPLEDALLLLVPNPTRAKHPASLAQYADQPTTLGEIIRLLIDRPTDIFPVTNREINECAADETTEKTAQQRVVTGRRSDGIKALSRDLFNPPTGLF